MEWERGDMPPGRVMSNLKTGGLRDLLEEMARGAGTQPGAAAGAAPGSVAGAAPGSVAGAAPGSAAGAAPGAEEAAPSGEAWKPLV